MSKTAFELWSDAELNLRRAEITYRESTEAFVSAITSDNGGWPCEMEDPEFVIVKHDTGRTLLELIPSDYPKKMHMPFRIHSFDEMDI